ncbi:MAG: ATP-binding cassette domain-containing protein [Roseburia sp.]|nr:ATP-binding cassette domain-containing protein [Roseburia sp.]
MRDLIGSSMEYVIETQGLVKQYKTKLALNDVSVHVKRGDIYGLIGKNGAGKTTLMKLVLGLTAPTKGKILLFGNQSLNEGRKKIGSLIESPGLYKNCTAQENMYRFSVLYGADKNDIKPLLERVGLGGVGAKKAGEFSLGMRQRLGIAIALLAHPEILILDEPINGLDPAGIKEIRDIITGLNREGVTFVISSHLLDELAKVVTTYGIITDGSLAEEVTARDLSRRCRKSVRIVTDDNDRACAFLKSRFSDMNAELRADGVYLSDHFDQTARINKLLVESGFWVGEIGLSESGFEEYFIERLGR